MSNIEIALKGIGISVANNIPKELLYFCINEIDIKIQRKETKFNDKNRHIEI